MLITDPSNLVAFVFTMLWYSLICYFFIQLVKHQKRKATISFFAILPMTITFAPITEFMVMLITTIPLWFLLHKIEKNKEV